MPGRAAEPQDRLHETVYTHAQFKPRTQAASALLCCRQGKARMELSTRALTLRRGERTLMRDLSLSVGAGAGLHVGGRNGAGKTTLLRALAGLRTPAGGEVCWNGQPITADREVYAAALCFLPHLDGLAPDLSPREHLRLALAGRVAVDAGAIAAALARVDLHTAADRPARTLSAGQRRRAGLAWLLLARAPLWLLDEPLTALDGAGCALVGELIAQHLRDGGLAVVSTHQPLPGLHGALATLELGG